MKSVKERELPELDDDFAQTASEFDTLDELRADVRDAARADEEGRSRASRRATRSSRRCSPRSTSRCPRASSRPRSSARNHNLAHQLEAAGMTKDDFLDGRGADRGGVRRRDRQAHPRGGERAVRARQGRREGAAVGQRAELTEHIVRTRVALRHGPGPVRPAGRAGRPGAGAGVSEVVRGKALALVLERAKVTDESGRAGRPRGAARGRSADAADADDRARRRTAAPVHDARPTAGARPSTRARPHAATAPVARPGDAACAVSEHAPRRGLPCPGARR